MSTRSALCGVSHRLRELADLLDGSPGRDLIAHDFDNGNMTDNVKRALELWRSVSRSCNYAFDIEPTITNLIPEAPTLDELRAIAPEGVRVSLAGNRTGPTDLHDVWLLSAGGATSVVVEAHPEDAPTARAILAAALLVLGSEINKTETD